MSRDTVYLLHILEAISRIEQYTAVGRDEFLATPHWQDATIRQLEIIGEAVKNLSADLKDQRPAIPWRRIAGMRDVLIHNYMGVDLEAVWTVCEDHLAPLQTAVQEMLDEA